jgi:putative peptidoglycan lipid II flippase
MSLAGSALVVGLSTIGSRVLGLIRDSLIAGLVGAGPVGDALLVALRIPNLFRRVLSEGGLNAGFIPLHARIVREQGSDAAARFAGESLATLAFGLMVLLILVEVGAGLVVLGIAWGYRGDAETFPLAVWLTRLAAPFVVAATLASLLAAVLNGARQFTAGALAPLAAAAAVVIVLILLSASPPADPARAAVIIAVTVSVSGLLHAVVLVGAIAGTPGVLVLARPRLSTDTKRLLLGAAPVLAVSGAAQIMILASTQVASFTPGAVSWLYYADRLLQFPLGFVAVAVGIVLLPEIAERAVSAERGDLHAALNRALEAAFLLAVPAAVALALLAVPLCRVLFEHGAFGVRDTEGTAAILRGLAPGLLAAVAGKVLSQVFFARNRLAPALAASVAGILATVAACAILSAAAGTLGLGLGVSAGLTVHAALLGWSAWREGLWRADRRLPMRLVRTSAATAVMAVALIAMMSGLEGAFASGASTSLGIAALASVCVGGFLVFALSAVALRAVTPSDLRHMTSGGA